MIKKKSKRKIDIVKGIPAGFPSPASDLDVGAIDLNEMLIDRPAATYFVEVQGHSMTGAGIFTGDTLIVDKSVDPRNGSIVVAIVEGEFTVKRYNVDHSGRVVLSAENEKYPKINIEEGMNVEIWGVVRWVLHKVSI